MREEKSKSIGFSLSRHFARGEKREEVGPVGIGFLSLVGLLLIWLVLTSSLPYVFERTAPEFALQLSTHHPGALLTKAERARVRLLAMMTSDFATTSKEGARKGRRYGKNAAGANLGPGSTAVLAGNDKRDGEQAALRTEIAALARRILVDDPLNARAFRMLAELEDNPVRVRVLMLEAMKRSRRESTAVFWLLNDSVYRKDFKQALDYADLLYRTRRALTKYVMSYLGQIADHPHGRALIVERLAAQVSWRSAFFNALPRVVLSTNAPLDLMIDLKSAGHPPSPMEMKPYLTSLIAKDQADLAYSVWLQLLPEEELSTLGLLYNPSFESDPSGLPFDWHIGKARNASLNFMPRVDGKEGRVLQVRFGTGRITFPTLSQVVMLVPGSYGLLFEFRGKIVAKRGLRWRVSCLQKKSQILVETDMLKGVQRRWKTIELDFRVPDVPGCRAQVLRLFHDARSASEQFISGAVLFDALDIKRVER